VSSHGTEGSECIQSPVGGIDVKADIDWKMLRDKATEAAGNAYAPYSGFSVGAAALVADGRMVAGCNVENVSYGLGLCAECSVVSALYSGGGGRLIALSCVSADGEPLMPCGRCRQVLLEHGGPQMLVDHPLGPRPLGDLLPDAFGPDDLARGEPEKP
jgi:cytidine deaminase